MQEIFASLFSKAEQALLVSMLPAPDRRASAAGGYVDPFATHSFRSGINLYSRVSSLLSPCFQHAGQACLVAFQNPLTAPWHLALESHCSISVISTSSTRQCSCGVQHAVNSLLKLAAVTNDEENACFSWLNNACFLPVAAWWASGV